MTSISDKSREARSPNAQDAIRQKISKMLEGYNLQIRELAYELVIINPGDLDKGQIHVAYSDGYVSWERVAWDYWGHLEGFEDEENAMAAQIGADKIISTLSAKRRDDG